MNHFLILSIFIFIFSNPLLSQAGFQKSLKDGYSNALVGTLISNDTLIIQHFLNDQLKGFFPSILIVDTFGNVNKKFIENQYLFQNPESKRYVELQFGSIHSVKGRTHLATLILETYNKTHNIKAILKDLCNKPVKTKTKP